MAHAFAQTQKTFKTAPGKTGRFFSLPALAEQFPKVSRLPLSMRIVLESVLRIAARSASSGTPVKSCRMTRATTKGISSVRSALGNQFASC